MNVTGLWAKYASELAEDPLLVVALTAALVAFATTPIAFAVLGRLDWFKARRGRVMQRPEFSSIVAGMILVMAIPAIFAALVLKSRSFDRNRYEFDPNKTWSVLEQGRGFKSLKEADAAVKHEMERLALERKNLVDNVKKLDEAMLALRAVAGTSPAVAQAFPGVLQSLAGVRKSVGVDGPQQLHDFTAPPAELRNLAAEMPAVVAPAVASTAPDHRLPDCRLLSAPATGWPRPRSRPSWPLCPSPRRPSPPCFPWPTCRRAGPWASRARSTLRPSTPTTSTRRSTAAPRASSSMASRAWPTPSTTPPATRRTSSSSTSSRWPTRSRRWASTARRSPTRPRPSRSATRATPRPAAPSSTPASTTPRSSRPRTTPSSPPSPWSWPSASPPARSQVEPPGHRRRQQRPQPVDEPGNPQPRPRLRPSPPTPSPRPPQRLHPRPTSPSCRPAASRATQVRRPGCLWLQLPLRRLHGRLQGGRGHLAGLPPPLPGRKGGQGGAREVHRRRQARRGRG